MKERYKIATSDGGALVWIDVDWENRELKVAISYMCELWNKTYDSIEGGVKDGKCWGELVKG